MRKFLKGLLAVGLLAAPTFGAANVDVQVLVNGASTATVAPGSTVTVQVQFKATATPVVAVGGDVTGTVVSGAPTATYVSGAYASAFQGFQPVVGDDGITTSGTIPPEALVGGALGGITHVGTAQNGNGAGGWNVGVAVGQNAFATVLTYSFVAGSTAGVIDLQWVDVPLGYNGWYTTDKLMNNGILTNTKATVTIGSNPITLTSSSVDNAVAGKKTISRAKKAVVRMTFSGAPGTLGVIANPGIKIVQCLAGGVEGTDVTSNFTFTVEAGNVLKILDNSATGVLVNKTWYAIRNTGAWTGCANFTKLTPVLIGDVDGNGILTSAGDIGPIVSKLSSPSFGTVDDDRRDLDGNKICTSAGDVGPAVTGLSAPSLGTKPAGW